MKVFAHFGRWGVWYSRQLPLEIHALWWSSSAIEKESGKTVDILYGGPAQYFGHRITTTYSGDDHEVRVTIDRESCNVLTKTASGPLREIVTQKFFVCRGGLWCLGMFGGETTTKLYFYDIIEASGTITSSVALQLICISRVQFCTVMVIMIQQFSVS